MSKNILLAACALAGTLVTHDALAVDYYVEGAVAGGGSTWGFDPNVQGALRTGFEFLDIVSVDVQGRLGYAAVDQRILMAVGLGTKLALPFKPVLPYVRLSAIHFHETPVAAMHHDTFMHVMGVADGIRHRFGFEGGAGVSWEFVRVDSVGLEAQAEAFVDVFPDDGKGPMVYGGAGLGLGMQYSL